ncbi:uncharacterized protein LOC129577078 [Sitodiplosis mosellana]|uniref:uncharacterized protein LOC129577078 n=1 Tax=Sitodiplosis mosellana TaxID=263140 RepID=UPI00244522CA|nr:uncharacterized protein LOC129577078 [Sitodiplosis mosellana]
MLKLVRNVSQRFARNQVLVKPTVGTIKCTVSRQYRSLSKANKQMDQHKQKQPQQQQQRCQIPSLYLRCNFYSTDPPNEDEPSERVERMLPKLNNDKIVVSPPFFGFIIFPWKALQIRRSYDSDFSLDEFVEGSKKAVEIVSDKLASGDFDGLRGLVKDDIIESLRNVIVSWREEQRSELRVMPGDICRLFLSDIQIQEDSGIVDICMIYHLVKGFKELTSESKITPSEFIKKSSQFLDDNFFILNYTFTKGFSKDSNNDWIVSYINHVNISDEMREQTKGIEEMMKKRWTDYENEKKKRIERMLLANCVRRINKINITKCLNKSLGTSNRRCVAVASSSSSTENPLNFGNGSLPNLTSTRTVFTSSHRHHNNHLWCSHRYYSNDTQHGKDRKEDTDDDDLEGWSRKLPRFGDMYVSTPSVYLMLKNALSTLLIRSYFDQTFNRDEFLSGARQAVEVVSNLLAVGNFEALRDMVDDDTIDKMRHIVGSMSPEQRQWIVVNDSDIQWIFPYEIQFITKENTVKDKSRFFVEIMVVIHAYRDNDVELSDVLGKPNAEIMHKLEKNYSVANYRFIKEFTKGVEDDWTINHILHVKPTDEMKEKEKLLKEL